MPETMLGMGMYNRKRPASGLHFLMKKHIINEEGRLIMWCVRKYRLVVSLGKVNIILFGLLQQNAINWVVRNRLSY